MANKDDKWLYKYVQKYFSGNINQVVTQELEKLSYDICILESTLGDFHIKDFLEIPNFYKYKQYQQYSKLVHLKHVYEIATHNFNANKTHQPIIPVKCVTHIPTQYENYYDSFQESYCHRAYPQAMITNYYPRAPHYSTPSIEVLEEKEEKITSTRPHNRTGIRRSRNRNRRNLLIENYLTRRRGGNHPEIENIEDHSPIIPSLDDEEEQEEREEGEEKEEEEEEEEGFQDISSFFSS